MTVLTEYRPDFPPGDTSTATPGDDAIDVGRIILNPNWSHNREDAAKGRTQVASGAKGGAKTGG